MAHVRKTIRDNIVTACTGLTTTGSRVYRSRVYPLDTTNLPGLCIYTRSEDIEVDTLTRPRSHNRNLSIVVEAYVRGTSNFDNSLDTIATEIEVALTSDVTRGGNAKDTYLASTEFEFADEGEQPIAFARMTWAVEYRTSETAPETAT